MQRHETDRVTQLVFDGLPHHNGSPLRTALPKARKADAVDAEAADHLQRAVNNLEALDNEAVAGRRMHWLSDSGRYERVKPHLEHARRAADSALIYARHQLGVIADRRAALYAPPAIDDATAALRDRELRDKFDALDREHQGVLRQAMANGEHGELLAALMRDPLPNKMTEAVRRAIWQPKVEREHAKALQELDDAEEAATATRVSAEAISGLLDQIEKQAPLVPRPSDDLTYGAQPGSFPNLG